MSDKPIIVQTPQDVSAPQVRFNNKPFDSVIYDKGYDVYIDRALRCPCISKATGQGLSDCQNCLGNGWLFVNRTSTRLVVQGMNANKKYENWTEETTGMARVTARGIDRLTFMDRITLINIEGIFTQIVRPETFSGDLIAYSVYELKEITEIYKFVSSTTALALVPAADYTISGSKITFDETKYTNTDQFSIRYYHDLVYHVIDINRDVMKTRVRKSCLEDPTYATMPVAGTLRKVHYIFDKVKFELSNLFENSETPNPDKDLLNTNKQLGC